MMRGALLRQGGRESYRRHLCSPRNPRRKRPFVVYHTPAPAVRSHGGKAGGGALAGCFGRLDNDPLAAVQTNVVAANGPKANHRLVAYDINGKRLKLWSMPV